MKQEKNKEEKRKTGMARCLELASEHKGLVIISGILSALAAVCSFIPYLSIYFVIRELILVFPDMPATDVWLVCPGRHCWKCGTLFLCSDVFPSGSFWNIV